MLQAVENSIADAFLTAVLFPLAGIFALVIVAAVVVAAYVMA